MNSASPVIAEGQEIEVACRPTSFMFVVGKARRGEAIVDPLADRLTAIGAACDDSPADVERFLSLTEVFPQALAGNAVFREAVRAAYANWPQGILAIVSSLKARATVPC